MRIGYVITNLHQQPVARVGQFTKGMNGEANGTINQAEYLALIEAMRHAFRLGFTEVDCTVDSQLLARQLSGHYQIKDRKLVRLYREVREIGHYFRAAEIHWEPRGENTEADRLTHVSVFEEPPVTVQPSKGRRPRMIPDWLAARARRLVAEQIELRGEYNPSVLARLLRFDLTGVRQLLRGATYRAASEEGAPNWDSYTGPLAAVDDATGWPDAEDLEEIVGDPYPYEDAVTPATS